MKSIKCYETKVKYIVKNAKGEEREDTNQYYSSDYGFRIEFGDEKVKIYKNDNIYVKDSLDDSEYVLDEGMDMLHSLAFMNKILSYPLKSNSIKKGKKNGEMKYTFKLIQNYSWKMNILILPEYL